MINRKVLICPWCQEKSGSDSEKPDNSLEVAIGLLLKNLRWKMAEGPALMAWTFVRKNVLQEISGRS